MSTKLRRIRIESNGEPMTSRIVDVESGETLDGILSAHIDINQDTNFVPVMTLRVMLFDMDILGKATILEESPKEMVVQSKRCWCCGENRHTCACVIHPDIPGRYPEWCTTHSRFDEWKPEYQARIEKPS